jgi:hypothetical protein
MVLSLIGNSDRKEREQEGDIPMSSSVLPGAHPKNREASHKPFIGDIGFDRVTVALCCWFIGGLYLDGWAHGHGLVDKTFFTPWHAILYSGYAACALSLIIVVVLNHQRGRTWLSAIPRGYGLTLLGVPLFLVAGIGDMVWHILFGFEVGIEPLLSPTHLLLALSGFLILSGPLRAAWQRADSIATPTWAALLPALLSLLAIFSLFTFFTEFAHPFVQTYTVTNTFTNAGKSLGAAGILLQAAIMMGFVLFLLGRWHLPFGAFTLLFTLNGALMSVLADEYRLIPGVLVAGIIADLLYRVLKPSITREDTLRIFSFIVPAFYYLCYFLTLMITGGITWSIHLWLGSSVIVGVLGLVLSYLLVPPNPMKEGVEAELYGKQREEL